MGRPRKYEDPYGGQKAYFKTPKGKAARKRYQSSDKGKEVKRDWWQKNRGKTPLDPQQYFIDTYGDPDTALQLLPQKQKLVIKYLYGLDGGEPLTQEAIADLMGYRQQWIAQLKKKAIDTLNDAISKKSLSPYAKLEAAKLAKAEASEQDQNPSPTEAQQEEI